LCFFDAWLADREHKRRANETFRHAALAASRYGFANVPLVTAHYYRQLPELPDAALRMSPRRVIVEADASRLLAIVRSPQWCASLRSLVLVPVPWQQHLPLDVLSSLECLTELVVQPPGETQDRDAAGIAQTLGSLPLLSCVTRFECREWFPTAQQLETLGKALPALREWVGLRHTRMAPRLDPEHWVTFPHLTRCVYEAVYADDDDDASIEQHLDDASAREIAAAVTNPFTLPPTVTDLDLTVFVVDRPTRVGVYRQRANNRRVLDWPPVGLLRWPPPSSSLSFSSSSSPSSSQSRPIATPRARSYAFETLAQYGRLRRLVVRAVHLTLDPCELMCRLPALRELTVYAAHMRADCPSPTPFVPEIAAAFTEMPVAEDRDFSIGCGGDDDTDGIGCDGDDTDTDGCGGGKDGECAQEECTQLLQSPSSCDRTAHLSSSLERLALVGVLPDRSSIRLPPILMPHLRHLRVVAHECNFFPCGLSPTATVDREIGGGVGGGNPKA
jgi:hypothetical protein